MRPFTSLTGGLGGDGFDAILAGFNALYDATPDPDIGGAFATGDIVKIQSQPGAARVVYAQPGETLVGVGCDFVKLLASGETLVSAVVVCTGGIVGGAPWVSGTRAALTIHIPDAAVPAEETAEFTVTGSLDSVRKFTRHITIYND